MKYFLTVLFLLGACSSYTVHSRVKPGDQVLAEQGFAPLKGKRVGLITNHTAMIDSVHLIDLLYQTPGITLTALFGPEHGLRGHAAAGEHLNDGIDDRTGVPVYSLYGRHRRPTPEMLKDVDILVFDIQDIGARFYTYISTMGLAMQAAAEKGIPFMVLDRPNPLGNQIEGFVLDTTSYRSFVGMYPIPITHGFTVGELATAIQAERWLPGLDALELIIIPVEGWHAHELWSETGLPWIPPSPNIPDEETALLYPGAALIEGTIVSEGRGTKEPFKLIGAPWLQAEALADTLNARHLPGVHFEPVSFTPRSIPSMAPSPKWQDTPVNGIRQRVTDPHRFRPVATGIHVLHAIYHQTPDSLKQRFFRLPAFHRLAGTDTLYTMLVEGARPEHIIRQWQQDVEAFRRLQQTYRRYP